MTMLTIVQNALSEVGVSSPNSVENGSDQKPLALLNREVVNLIQDCDWQALVKRFTITTVAAQTEYDLPTDWARFPLFGTFWDTGRRFKLVGPLTPQEWERVINFNTDAQFTFYFRIFADKFQIFPAPSGGETIVFEYISKNAVIDGTTSNPKQKFTLDADTTVFDEELLTMGLVWRFKRQKGLDFETNLAEYNSLRDSIAGREKSARDVVFGITPDPFVVNIPEGDFNV